MVQQHWSAFVFQSEKMCRWNYANALQHATRSLRGDAHAVFTVAHKLLSIPPEVTTSVVSITRRTESVCLSPETVRKTPLYKPIRSLPPFPTRGGVTRKAIRLSKCAKILSYSDWRSFPFHLLPRNKKRKQKRTDDKERDYRIYHFTLAERCQEAMKFPASQ